MKKEIFQEITMTKNKIIDTENEINKEKNRIQFERQRIEKSNAEDKEAITALVEMF